MAGKSIFIFFIMFPILLLGQNRVVLKNGTSFESRKLEINKTWVQLDSLNGNQAVMFAVIDSIITPNKSLAGQIKKYLPSVSSIIIDNLYILKFPVYIKVAKVHDNKESEYTTYYRLNILFIGPMEYNIELINSDKSFTELKKSISTGLSFGFEFLRSLSNSVMMGIRFKYQQLNYDYEKPSKNLAKWKNDLIGITAIYDQKLYGAKNFELKVQMGLGILLSYQKYANSESIDNFHGEYKGSGVVFDILPLANFPFGNFQIHWGVGYSWSTFRLLYYEKEFEAVSTRSLFNNYNSMKMELGFGYRF